MNQSLEIFWLANSARTFQGKPDAKYGVAISAGGRHVFVKHAPPDSNPQGATLVAAERHLLKTLASQGLPIPTLVEHAASDPDTLITEYCGVSLASLLGASAGQPELTNAELGRIFSGCLRSAAPRHRWHPLPRRIRDRGWRRAVRRRAISWIAIDHAHCGDGNQRPDRLELNPAREHQLRPCAPLSRIR